MTLKHSLLTGVLVLLSAAPAKSKEASSPYAFSNWGFSLSDLTRAWRLTESKKEIIVAVIDTGADTSHPALVDHLWTNPGESGIDNQGRSKSSNGIDDDQNGYIDDVHGWNFADNSNVVADKHGHGTHVAGIIAGAAPKASVMILKYFNPDAPGVVNQVNTLKAIEYATRMKVQIINYSAGGTDRSSQEEAVIAKAAQANILFVAAAGNERSNSDIQGFYPANYDLPNIVSVTAVDALQGVLPSSNFGRNTVDIAAPGKNIDSAAPGGKHAVMTGTSQATAFVSGTAALLMAQNPSLNTPEALIPYLVQAGIESETLLTKTRSGRALNAYQSLTMKGSDLAAFGQRAENSQDIASVFLGKMVEDELPFAMPTVTSKPDAQVP